ncbi:ribonuclease P protein subunit Rpp29 [Halorientalis persicus]|jgi:ribonuclease P protein subunit POP4|uniref:Ribonuclease P protein component 1 n=1 Tax=Halorientalis persicus TaxID=1367881 RepID=A0A1H8DHE1_9EURY|nr:ribonuclease P protein component 1 [Halorientalis persicus]SEN06184.1 ribonuclease P protein subunit Rpp29 [Halorientalis persicus]
MPLTPATLTRHELIGRPVRVVAASNPDLVGIAGEVVMETTRTLSVEGSANGERRVWQVPKADATFEFTLDDGDTQVVTVEGEQLVARPARRTERTGDSKWR